MKIKATFRHWMSESLTKDLSQQIEKLRHAEGIEHIRLMPDGHLANDVCVGSVIATSNIIYPSAVGGDIGCGMLSVPLGVNADAVGETESKFIFKELATTIPIMACKEIDGEIGELDTPVSTAIAKKYEREGQYQLGTIGRGNHFLELQRCIETEELWVTIHTGSRCMGPAIRDYFNLLTTNKSKGLSYLVADSELGQLYLSEHNWARQYANFNRQLIFERFSNMLKNVVDITPDLSNSIHGDHNHVETISIKCKDMLVHRKGANSALKGELAIIPGSMGSSTFHCKGEGNPVSLFSSSHGAGRSMSRQLAKKTVTGASLADQLQGIFYQPEKLSKLTEESPSAYKNITTVMKQQKKLVRAIRRLEPVLNYKGV